MNPTNPTNSGFSSQGTAQATVILIIGTLLGRVLGFAREMVIASMFGATAETDAFLVALIIPGFLAGVVAGTIPLAFIPVFTKYRIEQGEEDAWRIASTLINISLIILICSVVLTFLAAPVLIPMLGPGLAKGTQQMAVHLTRVMSPAIILMGLVGLSTALLNSYKHFTTPAFAVLLYNSGIIAGALILSGRFGVTSLAIGVVFGSLGQLLIQSVILAKKRSYYTFSLNLNHPGIKRIAWLLLPFLVSSATGQLNVLVDRILASGLVAGSISALNFGVRVTGLPLGIFAAAIGVAVYPTLSQQVAGGRLNQVRNTFSEGIRMLWFTIIPVSVGLIVLREPIIRLLFERGAFGGVATKMTASAVLFYSLGLFARAANVMLTRTYFAMQDTRTPVKLGVISVTVNIILNLILVRYLALGGLALASSVASTVNFLMLAYFLRKKLHCIDGYRIVKSACKSISASLVMGVTCWLTLNLSRPLFADVMPLKQQVLQVGSLAVIGLLVYLALAILLRMEELGKIRTVVSFLRRR